MKLKILFAIVAFQVLQTATFSPRIALATDGLIQQTALQHKIPARLLKAIAYVESGRNGQIWPWTINVEGQAHYFKDRASAEAYLRDLISKGITNVDVGCMQINLRWHGQHFQNPCDLFSPEIAIPYAAALLKGHVQKCRSWLKAALLYHSHQSIHQEKYRERLVEILIAISNDQGNAPVNTKNNKSATAT